MTEFLKISVSLRGLLFLIHLTLANPVSQSQTEGTSGTETFKVSDLEFKDKLENPCAFLESNYSFAAGEDLQIVLSDLSYRNSLVQQAAQELLNTSVLKDCTTLEMPSVAVIPTLNDVKDIGTVEALREFYTSLINHTAHTYFLLEQLDRHSSDADCASTKNFDFAKKARTLASHMRQLMCSIRVGSGALGSSSGFDGSTTQILEEELVNQPLCSRRTVRDCQTAISTNSLVETFSAYIRSKMTSS